MFGFSKVKSISTAALEQKLKEKPIIIDVREPGEYRTGHIQGSRNVPLGTVSSYQAPANQTVYVICQSGIRSRRAYSILSKKGVDVVNVTGGMNAWAGKTLRN